MTKRFGDQHSLAFLDGVVIDVKIAGGEKLLGVGFDEQVREFVELRLRQNKVPIGGTDAVLSIWLDSAGPSTIQAGAGAITGYAEYVEPNICVFRDMVMGSLSQRSMVWSASGGSLFLGPLDYVAAQSKEAILTALDAGLTSFCLDYWRAKGIKNNPQPTPTTPNTGSQMRTTP
jgi:hypothetical protein